MKNMSDANLINLSYNEDFIKCRHHLVKENPNRYIAKTNKKLLNAEIVKSKNIRVLLLIFVGYD
jgi:hypothetical protein